MFKSFLKKEEKIKISINYIFFISAFCYLLFFSSFKTNLTFFLYSTLQAALITTSIMYIISKIKSKPVKYIFLGFFSFMLLIYFANFILIGLMKTSLMFAMKSFFFAGFENMIITFRALNLNLIISFCALIAFITIPIIGIATYQITNKISLKKPIKITARNLLLSILFLFLTIISLDIYFKNSKNIYIHQNQMKMPLGSSILSMYKNKKSVKATLKDYPKEEKLLNKIHNQTITADHKPNIFIFVVETFRKDFINKKTTPNLYNFSQENISFEKSFSAANATQISWYSIFHSNYPIYWAHANKNSTKGSIPLNILKKLGYKINVYTSAEMTYFKMDELLFGKNKILADNFYDLSTISNNPAIRDKEVINKLNTDLKQNKDSNIFVVFLDSTHSEYSWLGKTHFQPVANHINYITLSHSRKDLPLVINRYKNAVHFIDQLFGSVIHTLKETNLYDDAIIALTGDHAEEFDENGALFHSSQLNDTQTSVPIFFKLHKKDPVSNMASHIDIMPTILSDVIKEDTSSFFDGESIFNKTIPYTISVNQNGAFMPNEILIHSNENIHAKLNFTKNTTEIEFLDNYDNVNIKAEKSFEKLLKRH